MLRSLARTAIRKYERLTFRPYVAPDRRCGGDTFDFLIADPVAKAWYDSSPEQGLPEKLWCRDHIRPGFHAVDCGAHHGMMTVLSSKWVGGAGRVTCYEVIPANRDVIRKNLALNKCSNVLIRPFGVGERNETILLDANLGNADVRRVQRTSKFAVVSLDSDLAGSTVDLLKLDVEGSELSALRGARRTIREQRPFICLELHNYMFADRAATLREILSIVSPGYRLEILPEVLDPIMPLTDLDEVARFDNPHVFCSPLDNS